MRQYKIEKYLACRNPGGISVKKKKTYMQLTNDALLVQSNDIQKNLCILEAFIIGERLNPPLYEG